MSSIYGVVSTQPIPDLGRIIGAMSHALPETWEGRGDVWVSDDRVAAMGYGVHLRTPIQGQTAEDRESGARCWVEGTFDDPALAPQPAAALLTRLISGGTRGLLSLQDGFNAAVWEPRERRLSLANDRMGYRPLYLAHRDGLLVFASHMAQLAASRLVDLKPNPRALAELLGANSLLGNHTVFEGISVLGPAELVHFDERGLRTSRYFRLDEIEVRGGYDRARLDELEPLFLEACRRARGSGEAGLALSGGLDSRLAVAGLTALDRHLPTFTEGPRDSHDFVLARRVAEALDLPHQQVVLREEDVAGWLEPGISLLGGNVATLEVHPCHHFLQPGLQFDRIVIGLVGEYTRAAYPRPTDFDSPDFETLLKRLRLKVMRRAGTERDSVQLWRPEHSSLAHWTSDRLEETLRSFQWQDSPLDVADYYYLEVRGRRTLAKGPTMGRLGTEATAPYLHPDVIEAVLSIPTADRLGNRIQMDLIDRLAPSLNRIPYTSPPAYTTRTEEIRGERLLRWKKKLNWPSRRYAHAFDLAGWSRGPLRPALEEILYAPDAAFRSFLEWEPVKERLDSHFEGRSRQVPLVAALTSFDLAHRMWATKRKTD
ncbi:MAG: asparagine synthase-related protein [marine benthic group bacterium]|nr:asparagine synthase-related protein [Candidatus Benthicola marisminoris]